MNITLNQEQLSYLKGLNSKNKKRKFLLDCMLENIDLEISNFFSKDYVKSENIENVGKSIVFTNGMYKTSNKKEIELLDSLHPMILREVDESNYIDNENHLCWIFNRLISYGENPNFDYMIKLKQIADKYKESQEIIDKSNKPQPPMNFCVEITDENKIVLNSIWKNFNGHNRDLSSSYRFLNSNSGINYLCPSFDLLENYINISTDKFLTYIGREDLIEKNQQSVLPKLKFEEEMIDVKNHLCWIFNVMIGRGEDPNFDYMIKLKEIALNYSEPKQEVEEKVDLSKELYLTYEDEDGKYCIRVTSFEEEKGFGFDFYGEWKDDEQWAWITAPEYWRKPTPEEIEQMLVKKLEADGLKVGCIIQTINEVEYHYDCERNPYYDKSTDTLFLGSYMAYEQGKFAKIIPQEESLTESNELINSSDKINEILVVDFENVSEKQKPS